MYYSLNLLFVSSKRHLPAILNFSIVKNLKRMGFIFPSMFCFSLKSAANGCDCGVKSCIAGIYGFIFILFTCCVHQSITEYKDRNNRRSAPVFRSSDLGIPICKSARAFLFHFPIVRQRRSGPSVCLSEERWKGGAME